MSHRVRDVGHEIGMSDRWSIYIDIEGFSTGWDKDNHVLWSLGELMRAIFRIGQNCCPRDYDRLFAHQFGDGFIVVSDFHEESLERCIAIAVALMRHVAASGCFARAAIAEGEFSDIKGCYPDEVLKNADERHHVVWMGAGLMTIIPVMGTALIRAVSVDKAAPKGPLLIAELSKSERFGSDAPWQALPKRNLEAKDVVSIDWVHMTSKHLSVLQEEAPLSSPSSSDLEARLRDYCSRGDVPVEWRANAVQYLNVTL